MPKPDTPGRTSTALITGASSGIGAALAPLFARDGWHLVLVARTVAPMEALATQLRGVHGVTVTVIPSDLSMAGAAARLAAELQARGIVVDALVNNAGFGLHGAYASTDAAKESRMLAVNVVALTELTKALLPGMLARGHGRIMNVGSVGSFVPGPLMAVYYASKAYVLSYSEALAEELAGTGVRVTALCPGLTRTRFQARAGLPVGANMAGDVEPVARDGYAAMMRGARVVVPGLLNRLAVTLPRFAPRRLVAYAVKRIQSGR
jgi:short-subunit dehydrogenase